MNIDALKESILDDANQTANHKARQHWTPPNPMEKEAKTTWRQVMYRIPGLGYTFKWFVTLIRLPTRIAQLYSQCEHLLQERSRLQREIDLLRHAYRRKESSSLQHLDNLDTRVLHLERTNLATQPSQDPSQEEQDAKYYHAFEEHFRGTRESVLDKLQIYRPFLEKVTIDTKVFPIADLGSGRGEWLHLLKECGLKGHGIDTNLEMIQASRSFGFSTIPADALSYLKNLPDQTLGGVTGFHIIEHLPAQTLIELIEHCFRVVAPGGIVVFETPNPENINVGSCTFYTDPTHVRPIPPSYLSFLFGQKGFTQHDMLRLSPLKSIDFASKNLDPEVEEMVRRFYGAQDYAIIAQRP